MPNWTHWPLARKRYLRGLGFVLFYFVEERYTILRQFKDFFFLGGGGCVCVYYKLKHTMSLFNTGVISFCSDLTRMLQFPASLHTDTNVITKVSIHQLNNLQQLQLWIISSSHSPSWIISSSHSPSWIISSKLATARCIHLNHYDTVTYSGTCIQ